MGREYEWNDYLEPEIDGPELHCVLSCPKCGNSEVVPEGSQTDHGMSPTVNCQCCKILMFEDAGS